MTRMDSSEFSEDKSESELTEEERSYLIATPEKICKK